jgi:hypothetical protein
MAGSRHGIRVKETGARVGARKDHWTLEEYDFYLRTGQEPRYSPFAADPALPTSNVESNADDGPKAADASKTMDKKFRVHFHSRRRRAIDPDGLYGKAALDGIVAGGILSDDSAKVVEAVTYSQEISEVEETVIEVYEVIPADG